MMPYPPYPFLDLAQEHLGAHARNHEARKARARRTGDYDDQYYALAPDPVFMGLRALVTAGPIGALARRIDRWIEAREDRRYGQTIDGAVEEASRGLPTRATATFDAEPAADRDERIAA